MSPSVSIVIPTVNARILEQCLTLLSQHTPRDLYELVIVCDEPIEQRKTLLAWAERNLGARVLVNAQRVGIARAINQGTDTARAGLILWMNDDILVKPGWLPPLVQALTDHPEFGIASPIVERESRDRPYYFATIAECSLMTREVWDKVGRLDEDPVFRVQAVDGDYYVRLTRAGYHPHGVTESSVQHVVGQTIKGTITKESLSSPMKLLAKRYGDEHKVNQHALPAYSTGQGKDLPSRLLLYLTPDLVGEDSGGGRVTKEEVVALNAIGQVVVYDRKTWEFIGRKLPQSPFMQDYQGTWRVNELLQEGTPELAQIYSGIFSQTVRLLRSRGTKVAYTVAAHDRRRTISEFARVGMEYPFTHVSDPSLWVMHKTGFLEADVVIAPSIVAAEFLIREGCQNVMVVPHGVDLPGSTVALPDTFTAGYLGQGGLDKGISYLMRGWAALGTRRGERLLVGGPNSDSWGLQLAVEAGAQGVQCLGWVQDKPAFFRSLSVYVQPSVTESWGIPVVEAMSHGRPVIVTDGVGSKDVIADGVNGFVVPAREPGAIYERLEWCRRNPDKLVEMGVAAAATAAQYQWPLVHKMYCGVWESLLK